MRCAQYGCIYIGLYAYQSTFCRVDSMSAMWCDVIAYERLRIMINLNLVMIISGAVARTNTISVERMRSMCGEWETKARCGTKAERRCGYTF
jgi:hypothetical protein